MMRFGSSKLTTLAVLLLLVAGSSFMTSCSGGGVGAREMVLIEFLIVDRSLKPVAPTGTESLPRNAQLMMVFSELVNPQTVTDQTIQVRFGPAFQSVPTGSLNVNANTVVFDPTVTAQGEPNPFGFLPLTQYQVDIPNFEEQQQVVENADFDPVTTTFFTTFITAKGFLRELIPPEVLNVFFVPDPDPLTKNIPGNGLLAVEFNEAMDPSSFTLGPFGGPDLNTTFDVRYTNDTINVDNLINFNPIPGTFTHDAAAKIFFFKPLFSFGEKKYVFTLQLFQGLQDLSGNLLINPQSYGPFTCDGNGIPLGRTLIEDFNTTNDRDTGPTDADWGLNEPGALNGAPITSRQAYMYTYTLTTDPDTGQSSRGHAYGDFDMLTGAALNQFNTNVVPPTSEGRRVIFTYSDTEIGADGAITAAAWGPDSNQTRAAYYPNVILRAGFQADDSLSIAPNFLANYEGLAPTVLYDGDYSVAQNSNIGNTPGHPSFPHTPPDQVPPGYSTGVGGPGTVCWPTGGQPDLWWNHVLFDFTGWYPWPEFTSFFEWTQGDPAVENDRVMVFDISSQEGDTWQTVRTWQAITFPCSGVLIDGHPTRTMWGTYEGSVPNPPECLACVNQVINPDIVVCDMCFTVTKRRSVAQSLFYYPVGDPNVAFGGATYGDTSNYGTPLLSPQVQEPGVQAIIEFQGAQIVDDDRKTINAAGLATGWTQDINDCDGFPCIRWRVTLVSNLETGDRARLVNVIIPITDDF